MVKINNIVLAKVPVWHGFSGRNRLNSHSTPRPPRQRLPSDGFFEHDASHLLSALSTHPGVASEKALASTVRNRGQVPDAIFNLPQGDFRGSIIDDELTIEANRLKRDHPRVDGWLMRGR